MTAPIHLLAGAALAGLVMACQSAAPPDAALATLTTCREAFQHWVDGDAALNAPGADIVAVAASQDRVQRRVFELCSLTEAEELNREIRPERPGGIALPLVQPDIRTFATVECVDEAPLLDGTGLCAEVRR